MNIWHKIKNAMFRNRRLDRDERRSDRQVQLVLLRSGRWVSRHDAGCIAMCGGRVEEFLA